MRDFRKRFEEKIAPDGSGCWRWTSASSGRYGVFWLNGKNQFAHRLAYELYKGIIPPGMFVCHTCDNGHCVNPDHLFLGTPTDNIHDMIAKGRQRKQHGERNPCAKLKWSDIPRIHGLRESGLLQREIAERFGVRREAIGKVLRNERWVS